MRTLRPGSVVEADHILAVQFSLKIDETYAVTNFFLLEQDYSANVTRVRANTDHGNEIDVQIGLAELIFNVHKSGLRDGFGVDGDALSSQLSHQLLWAVSYLTEICEIPLVAGLLKNSPRFVGHFVGNTVQVELAMLRAFHSLVACDTSTFCLLELCIGHTLRLAVLTDIRRSLRALGSGVSFGVADTASTLEHTRLGAFELGVTG